jgi:hypothetical protein
MREVIPAMFAEMVPRMVFAHRLDAKGGQLKTLGAINKPWHEGDDFCVRRLICWMVHILLPTNRRR